MLTKKKRILVFLNPNLDHKNSGYHLIQSKIALGSGGIWGKGYLQSTQCRLDFLPEKQTDFIFSMFVEEWGFAGAIALIGLYFMLIMYCYYLAQRLKDPFEALATSGFTSALFIYVFINMAMVMGIVPVVGVPLPLMSYGGTSLVSLMISFGIIFSFVSSYKMNMRKSFLY